MTDIKRVRLLTETLPSGITRWMEIQSGWDEMASGRGIHGAELRFGVQRGKVAVTLNWMTPFFLPETRRRLETGVRIKYEFDGLGGIEYHSPIRLHEWQSSVAGCEYTGGDCYGDGTAIGAGELFDQVVADPGKLWPKLEEWLVETEQRIEQEQAAQAAQGGGA